jgi:putative oxidoreductase
MSNLPRAVAAPIGRLLLSLIFLMSGANKIIDWSGTQEFMAAKGMSLIPLFLLAAILFEIVGGLSVLAGFKARLGALLLIAFLVPVTWVFHGFWRYEDPQRTMEMIQLMKNLAILGGLFTVLAHGAGPVSFDARAAGRSETP